MIRSQKKIYKFILIFSVLINLFLLGLLFFVLRDSLSGTGDYFLEGKNFWYFVGIIMAYCIVNSYFIIQLLKKATDVQPEKSIE